MNVLDEASLGEETVSLWWAALDGPPERIAELPSLEADLSPAERQRARNLLRPGDHRRFVAAHAWLRRLLAGELGCAPSEVPIIAAPGGKPRLAGGELKFSLSRSGDVALFALSRTLEVGVDVEATRADADLDRLAARFFSPAEQQALAALPPARRRRAGFQCWTRKEAYLKGTGAGLSVPLSTTQVGISGRCAVGRGWSVHQVDLAPGFAAAVAGAATGTWTPQAPRQIGGASKWQLMS